MADKGRSPPRRCDNANTRPPDTDTMADLTHTLTLGATHAAHAIAWTIGALTSLTITTLIAWLIWTLALEPAARATWTARQRLRAHLATRRTPWRSA